MKATFLIFILLIIFIISGPLSAQKKEVLLTIGETEISKTEFERIYRKNNQNLYDESDVKSPEDYLELFINFKLKVEEATALKMDTAKSFVEELAGYRKELAAPYLTDMKYDEELIKELYRRMTKEVNASHILFRISENAAQEQERAVYQKAQNVKKEILAGKPFQDAAVEYSEDPSAKSNQGNLGYFSAFQMVTPFENAAFSTPVGEISEPVRTSFGYHLIKVHDVRKNQGEMKVAHIMKMFPRGNENFDKTELKAEIDSVYEALLGGADFAEMARTHSDDKRSAAQGGEMPAFTAGRMIPEFSEPAFALKNPGDITPPITTPFGYHIIKKIEHRPVAAFDEARAEIENRIQKDPARSSSTQKAFVEKLKNEYNFKASEENLDKTATWEVDAETKENLLLFTIDNQNFFVEDFKNFLQKENITTGTFSGHYEAWIENEIVALEDARLEKKYPEFGFVMQEYHDGLLLFSIMEEKIWKFAAEDSAGLEKFYLKNKDKYHWKERFKGVVVTCENEETRKEAEKYFDAGIPAEEILDQLNKNEQTIDINEGAWEKGVNEAVDYYVWDDRKKAGFQPELTFVSGGIIPPQPKKLDEARGMYISEYQDFLEQNWLKALRKKYKVKVNKKLLKSIPHV